MSKLPKRKCEFVRWVIPRSPLNSPQLIITTHGDHKDPLIFLGVLVCGSNADADADAYADADANVDANYNLIQPTQLDDTVSDDDNFDMDDWILGAVRSRIIREIHQAHGHDGLYVPEQPTSEPWTPRARPPADRNRFNPDQLDPLDSEVEKWDDVWRNCFCVFSTTLGRAAFEAGEKNVCLIEYSFLARQPTQLQVASGDIKLPRRIIRAIRLKVNNALFDTPYQKKAWNGHAVKQPYMTTTIL